MFLTKYVLVFNQDFQNQKLRGRDHCAEFRDTSGTFSIACSAKFEIARVKRRETMAENGATSTVPCLFFIVYSALID